MSDDKTGPEQLLEHLTQCRQVDAAIVQDGNADQMVAALIARGWRYEGVEHVAGKRVRYLVPPERDARRWHGAEGGDDD